MRRPRVVVADEHALMLEGLQHILQSEFDIVGSARDGRALIDLVIKLRPDLVLTETTLPLLSGIQAVTRIKKKLPRIHAVFVTRHSDRQRLAEAVRAEASGYLLKTCSGLELIAALREVLSGHSYITPQITSDLFSTFRESVPNPSTFKMTQRQREILQLIVEGHQFKDIAALLNISRKTVEYHKYTLMHGLGIRTNTQLIQYAIDNGLMASE
jgi:DNA-binding NarL/FixJ family response regulator